LCGRGKTQKLRDIAWLGAHIPIPLFFILQAADFVAEIAMLHYAGVLHAGDHSLSAYNNAKCFANDNAVRAFTDAIGNIQTVFVLGSIEIVASVITAVMDMGDVSFVRQLLPAKCLEELEEPVADATMTGKTVMQSVQMTAPSGPP